MAVVLTGRRLFALAIFLSATLLFMVQPLAAKILLPVLGGSPAVWSTCLVFFQSVLLIGYLYAHALSTHVPLRWQRPVHIGVLIVAGLTLAMPTEIGEPGAAGPRWWLLRALASHVGLPFFALSATAPLLQRWFSHTTDPKANDPYFLYAASNGGSLIGLLGYLLVEPVATRSHQVTGWVIGFWIVAALIATCAYRRWSRGWRRSRRWRGSRANQERGTGTQNQNPEPNRLLWIVLALVPSALLLGVTQHLATDVVSAPLLWVVPLALYLMTFIAAFSTRDHGSARWWGAVAPVVVLVVLALSLAVLRYPILPIAAAHLAAFAVLAMLCHTRLAEVRPHASHLTEYFVYVSLGGALGSAAVALLAPVMFSWILEYPLAIGAAILLRPQTAEADHKAKSATTRWVLRAAAAMLFAAAYWGVSSFDESATSPVAQRLIRLSFAIPAILLLLTTRTALLFAGTVAGLLVGAGLVRTGGDVLYRERTFFGVHEVTSIQNGDWHVLTHGTTTHGVQAFRGKVRQLPTAYYHPTGPLGDIVFALSADGRFRDIGAIGLGAGALAGLRRQRCAHGLLRDRRGRHPHRGESQLLHVPHGGARASGHDDPDTGDRWTARRARDAGILVRSHRRRCVYVGRDTHAPHHARGRCAVHVAPQAARRDRLPRLEPVFQSAAGARDDCRRPAARVLHAQRQGRAAGAGRRGHAAVGVGRARARRARCRANRLVCAAMDTALEHRRSFVDRRLHERFGRCWKTEGSK